MVDTTQTPVPVTKEDPRYIDATIRQLPSLRDERERRIIDEMQHQVLSTETSRDTFRRLREVVLNNWQDAILHLDDLEYVHGKTQEGARVAAEAAKVQIAMGVENLDRLKKNKPVMIVSNHLGTFKLISLSPEELKERGIDHKTPSIYYPYLTYYMAFQPIGERLGDGVYEASFEMPGKLGELFRASGNIDVPPPEVTQQRTAALTKWSQDLIERHPNAALVVFPEGGTTGKRSGGKIYDLEEFHKGAFVIASQLGIPVLPVAQHFDVNRGGFDLGVLSPIDVKPNMPEEYYDEVASSARSEMQGWLDQRKVA